MALAVALIHRSLAELLGVHLGEEPIAGFPALWGMQPVEVCAVLERTAVVVVGHERHLVQLHHLTVNPALVRWRKDSGGRRTDNGQPGTNFTRYSRLSLTRQARNEQRRASDTRALRDQTEKAPRLRIVKLPRSPKPKPEHRGPRLSKIQRQELAAKGLKWCPRCKSPQPIEEFYVQGYCGPCSRAYNVALYQSGRSAKGRRQKRRVPKNA